MADDSDPKKVHAYCEDCRPEGGMSTEELSAEIGRRVQAGTLTLPAEPAARKKALADAIVLILTERKLAHERDPRNT